MSHTLVIKNGRVVLPDGIGEGLDLVLRDGRIAAVGRGLSEKSVSDPDSQVVDAEGLYVAPGFIDLHVHGVGDFMIERGPGDLADMCRLLTRYGVTGFLPTMLPVAPGEDAVFLRSLAEVDSEGPEILGFFLEGPFLKLTGAIPADYLGKPSAERVQSLIEAAKPHKAIFAASPDLEGVIDLIPMMVGDGNPVFITHTAANVDETVRGIEAGIRHATHFYDVFPCPDVREPGQRPCGAVEAVLADPRVTVDFILDGEHVEPIAVNMALECKGPHGVSLVTDANLGAGKPPGIYCGVGGSQVKFAYEGAPARMYDAGEKTGGLACSGLTMDRAVRNAVSMVGVDVVQAIRMGSGNPARVLGLEGRKGSITEGLDADIVLLDEELTVQSTIVGGTIRYTA